MHSRYARAGSLSSLARGTLYIRPCYYYTATKKTPVSCRISPSLSFSLSGRKGLTPQQRAAGQQNECVSHSKPHAHASTHTPTYGLEVKTLFRAIHNTHTHIKHACVCTSEHYYSLYRVPSTTNARFPNNPVFCVRNCCASWKLKRTCLLGSRDYKCVRAYTM